MSDVENKKREEVAESEIKRGNETLTGDDGMQKNGEGQEKWEKMNLEFESFSYNESFARVVVAAFMARMDPTIEELDDVKTAVSEAVTNAIIHGYQGGYGIVKIAAERREKTLKVTVMDEGVGIPDIEKAMEPLYTSIKGGERSGMGFSFMEAFMDELEVISEVGNGTIITMTKTLGQKPYE